MPAKNPKTKCVFVTGGVISSLGKGVTAASLGRLLRSRGYKITIQKFDPYVNTDPGTINPVRHGGIFVTNDGAETDLDLGHYKRFINESLTRDSNAAADKVYWTVLSKERHGDFGGGIVQAIPHITNEIKSRFRRSYTTDETKIAIIGIGGTIGNIESQPFLEAIHQFMHEADPHNSMLIHATLIPYLEASDELKTKPTRASVKDLQGMDVQPDITVCHSEHPLDDGIRSRISQFCSAPATHVLQSPDMDVLYEAPLVIGQERLAEMVCKCLNLPCPKPDLSEWQDMIDAWKHPQTEVTVALVGRCIQLHGIYISIVEALKHGGVINHAQVYIKWVDSETVTWENADDIFQDVKGVLIPSGFGDRGIDGKIYAIQYARGHNLPFLGLCLGMQLLIMEFARNVLGYKDAHSVELNPAITRPIIHLMPDQDSIEDIGSTLRLGFYPCTLDKGSLAYQPYGTETIHERHRHRYEVDNDFRDALTEHGMKLSGLPPDNRIMEMIELPDHPQFVAIQAHPELKSRPNHPHPLSHGSVQAALKT